MEEWETQQELQQPVTLTIPTTPAPGCSSPIKVLRASCSTCLYQSLEGTTTVHRKPLQHQKEPRDTMTQRIFLCHHRLLNQGGKAGEQDLLATLLEKDLYISNNSDDDIPAPTVASIIVVLPTTD